MHMYLVHDRDMGGLVFAFSQRMIKDIAEVVASTFCVSNVYTPALSHHTLKNIRTKWMYIVCCADYRDI